MSKFILYGGTPAARSELADKLAKNSPKHSVVGDWDGVTAIEQNTIVLTDLLPPFDLPLDCCAVGVGYQCACCGE